VPIVFFAFRIMVSVGMVLLGLAVTGVALRWKGRLYDARWFHTAAVLATPLGFIGVLAGWTVTETGRQPYVVYGLLRTAEAASPVAPGAIAASLAGFVLIYALLFLGFLWFALRMVLKGPPANRPEVLPSSSKPAPVGASTIPVPAE
jgi:cytochrome d ubiquinol oxidase subunit I